MTFGDMLPEAKQAAGWIPVLSDFFAFIRNNWGPLAFIAAGIAVFGMRVGPPEKAWYEVHGLLKSLWVGAQNIGLVSASLGRIEGKLDRVLRRYPDSDTPPASSAAPPSVVIKQ